MGGSSHRQSARAAESGATAPRIDYRRAAPGAYRAMAGLEAYVRGCGLERPLIELVKLRASQMNGCAYCLDMHTQDALADGESVQRLATLPAWRETPFFSPRERAALAWTEALTAIADGHAPDDVFEEARAHFSATELVNLTLAIVTINGWNRLAVGFRSVPGTYRPGAQ